MHKRYYSSLDVKVQKKLYDIFSCMFNVRVINTANVLNFWLIDFEAIYTVGTCGAQAYKFL